MTQKLSGNTYFIETKNPLAWLKNSKQVNGSFKPN